MQEPHIYYCHTTNQLTVDKPDGQYEMIFEPPKQCDNHYLGFKVGDFIQGWSPEVKDLYATIIILWKAKDRIELVHFQPNELRRIKKFSDISKFRIVKSADDIIAFFEKHRNVINERKVKSYQ